MKGKTGTRLDKVKNAVSLLLVLTGLAMTAIAFFAFELKLDNNPQMGAQRKTLAILGIICLFLAVYFNGFEKNPQVGKNKIRTTSQQGVPAAARTGLSITDFFVDSQAGKAD